MILGISDLNEDIKVTLPIKFKGKFKLLKLISLWVSIINLEFGLRLLNFEKKLTI